jgi:hypothetical protein
VAAKAPMAKVEAIRAAMILFMRFLREGGMEERCARTPQRPLSERG